MCSNLTKCQVLRPVAMKLDVIICKDHCCGLWLLGQKAHLAARVALLLGLTILLPLWLAVGRPLLWLSCAVQARSTSETCY